MSDPSIGQARPRVDGVLKVTGRASYAGDVAVPGMLHATLVQATIARGTILQIDIERASAAPGVVAIYTHLNLPAIAPPPEDFCNNFPAERRAPLSDSTIHYAGQHIALVLAETLPMAEAAAALIQTHYAVEAPVLQLRQDLPGTYQPDHFATNAEEHLQSTRGDAGPSTFHVAATYNTPVVHHNPMETYATVAVWNSDELLLHDSTRWVQGSRKIVAHMLGIEQGRVRVLTPFLGGAFGSKGFLWQHVALAAQAARCIGRPVKLVLTRQQMFTSIGHRPRTRQVLKLDAKQDGTLTGIDHATLTETSTVAHFVEPAGMNSRNLYSTPHATLSHHVAPTNLATPCFMRAPGESPGMFALESAIDELAWQARLDPLDLRCKNDAKTDLQDDRPWSSKHLRECYRIGAERFGWCARNGTPGSMRRGEKRIGWGMATASYPGRQSPVTVRATLTREGHASFSAATHELGAGTATAMDQIIADALEFTPRSIEFILGDSSLTEAPVAGASQTAASVGPAVLEAARQLRLALLQAATQDTHSLFYQADLACLRTRDDVILHVLDHSKHESIAAVLARLEKPELRIEASAQLDKEARKNFTFQSFGAHFAEVEIDEALGNLSVTRWVTVIDAGRILNPTTARSQILGGIIFGLGMALTEQTVYTRDSGRPLNANLSEYLLQTCADTPDIDVTLLDYPDLRFNAIGHRGIGEIGITGVPGAVANAVFHATGRRIRTLPISPEKLMR